MLEQHFIFLHLFSVPARRSPRVARKRHHGTAKATAKTQQATRSKDSGIISTDTTAITLIFVSFISLISYWLT